MKQGQKERKTLFLKWLQSYLTLPPPPPKGETAIATSKSNDNELKKFDFYLFIIKFQKIRKMVFHRDYGWSRSGWQKTAPPPYGLGCIWEGTAGGLKLDLKIFPID